MSRIFDIFQFTDYTVVIFYLCLATYECYEDRSMNCLTVSTGG